MSDEALTLSAVVLDKFSQPILDLQRKLRTLSAENAKQHTAGASLVKSHSEGYAKFSEQVHKTSEVFRREFSPVLRDVAEQASGLRFAFTGAAGAAAAVVGAVAKMSFNFAGSSFELENLGKATGWTTDALRRFEQLGPRIGTTTAAMAEGAKNVASIFQTMNKGQVGLTFERSELFEKLKDPNTVAAIERLRNLKPQQQIEGLEHIAEGIRSPADRRTFYKALGLPEEMASASAAELKKYSEEIKINLGTIPESSTEAGDKAARAWIDFKEKLQGVANYIGSEFAPTLENALHGAGDAVVGFERIAGGFSDAVKLDPAALAAWQDLGARIKGAMSALDDPADIANVANAVKAAIAGFDSVAKAVDSISTDHHVDWGKVLNVTGLADQIAKLRESAKAIEDLYEKIPGYKALQETKNPPTDAAPIPKLSSIDDAIKRLWEGSQAAPPATLHDRPPLPAIPSPPPAPTPAPPPFSFKKPEIGPPMPKPAFSPISYRPGDDNPMLKGVSNPGDAVRTIALGTRAGVAAGMGDFYLTLQAMKGLTGITPASYEPGTSGGAGGLGAGAGGLGAGGGSTGTGSSGAGAGGQRGGAGAGEPYTGGAANTKGLDPALVKMIRESAIAHHIDPNVALRVFKSEGGGSRTNYMQPGDYAGGRATSFGPFQFHRGGPGSVGTDYERQTGFSADDPSHMKEYLNFAFDRVRKRGWGEWMGAAKQGIRGRMGVEALAGETSPAPATPPGGTLTNDYRGLHLKSQESVAGGEVERGLAALAKHEQESEGNNFNVFSALRDRFHVFENPRSAHNEGLAFDATTKDRDYDAARERMRSYLNGLGLREGALSGGSGDYAIEGGTRDHLHVQFNSREASERYYALTDGKAARYAGLHDRPPLQSQHELARHGQALRDLFGHRGEQRDRSLGQEVRRDPLELLHLSDQRQAAASATHKITGGATLNVRLASGLAPVGGVKNTGNAFQTVKLDRAPSRVVADTTA